MSEDKEPKLEFEKIEDEGKSIRVFHKNKCGSFRATIKSPKATELSLKIMKAFDEACKEENKKPRRKKCENDKHNFTEDRSGIRCTICNTYFSGYCQKNIYCSDCSKLILCTLYNPRGMFKRDNNRETTASRTDRPTEEI